MTHQARRSFGTRPAWPLGLGWLLLVLAIIGVWANSVGGGPVFDDHFLVIRQSCFKSLRGLMEIFQLDAGACNYRPARYVSYGVDHAIFGDVFAGYHVGNIARHLLSTIVVGGLATALSGALRRGATEPATAHSSDLAFGLVVAALWSLHPVQTDSVSYVSGRRDILAGLWTFAAMWSALIADRRGGLWWLIPLWCTLFGFLAKESAVVIPALFFVWKFRGGGIRRWFRGSVSTFVAVVAGFVLSGLLVLYRGVFLSQSHHPDWWGGSIVSNFATVAALQVHYLRHVFYAHPLIGDYRPDTIPLALSFGDPRALLGIALIALLVAAALLLRRRRPLVAYGIAWYLISLTPVSHVFPHHELFAEHYLYIPLFGAALAMADLARWGLSQAPERWRQISVFSLLTLLVASGIRIVDRNRDFTNEQTFYENVLLHAPDNLRASANLANIYFDARQWDDATTWFLRLAPRWTPGSMDEMRNVRRLAEAAARAGQLEVALQAADQLIAHHPEAGAGYRWRAQTSLVANNFEASFEASQEWWGHTHDPRALEVGLMAIEHGGLGLSHAQRLADKLERTPGVSEELQRAVAHAIALRTPAPAAPDSPAEELPGSEGAHEN